MFFPIKIRCNVKFSGWFVAAWYDKVMRTVLGSKVNWQKENNFMLHYPFRQWLCVGNVRVVFSTCVEKWKMLSVANRFVIHKSTILGMANLGYGLRIVAKSVEHWIAVRYCGCASVKTICRSSNRITSHHIVYTLFSIKIDMIVTFVCLLCNVKNRCCSVWNRFKANIHWCLF